MLDNFKKMTTDKRAKSSIKLNIKAIKTGGLTWGEVKESKVNFLHGDFPNELSTIRV